MKKTTHAKATRTPSTRRKSAPEMISAAKRQTEALRLRQEGKTLPEIAEKLGYADKASAYNAVMRALCEATTEPNAEMRQLELLRLDELQAGLWPAAKAGDVAAVNAALKVMERRAKILGLDAAPKLPQGELDELIQREFNRILGEPR